MPELPEVETVRRSLERLYKNKTIQSVDILLERMILSPIEQFKKILENATFVSFNRVGKYLIFNFDNSYSLISHLRMEGKYFLHQRNMPIEGHPRVIFHLTDGNDIIYDDSRSFGIMKLCKTDDVYNQKEISKLGKEPFDIDDPNYLYNAFQKKSNEIKACLLDQEIMCGLGNIYADEVLFKCKINPFRKAKSISLEECQNIIKWSIETLNKAINLGGSTISSYHPELGVDGKFQNELLCYGKSGTKCPNCGSTLLKDRIAGRGTTYCPNCQKVAISVGITGKIASGKSTILKLAKDRKYPCFSSDEEVTRLYSLTSTKKELINIFGENVLNDNLTISKSYIKQSIANDPILKKRLEDYIHPLVKNEIIKFIASNKEDSIVFVEVPLMFESKSNLLVDYIIGIDCSYTTQIDHLKIRGSKTIDTDMVIALSNQFDKNVSKCDYLISNDGSLDELITQFDEVIKSIIKR